MSPGKQTLGKFYTPTETKRNNNNKKKIQQEIWQQRFTHTQAQAFLSLDLCR